jgi:hypothetical protein
MMELRPNQIEWVGPYANGILIEYSNGDFRLEVDIDNDGNFGYLIIVGREDDIDNRFYREGSNVPEDHIFVLIDALILQSYQ